MPEVRLKLSIRMRSHPLPNEIMDVGAEFEEEFSTALQKCRVPESVQQVLMEKQYTSSALFAFAFVDDSALEDFIKFLGTVHDDPPNWSASIESSSIRHLHYCCKQSVKNSKETPKPQSSVTPPGNSGSMGSLLHLAWADLPPARVKGVDFIAMKKEFCTKYP